MLLSERDLERFMSKVMPEPNTGCHLWIGACSPYGSFNDRPAHVVAYEIKNGPVPVGFHVHHRCEVKSCVNEEHLEAISQPDHMRLPKKARRTGKHQQKQEQVALVVQHFGSVGAVADFVGVTKQSVSGWKRIPDQHVRKLATRIPPVYLRPDLFADVPEGWSIWPETV